jgi:hypothetical protein
MSSCTTDSIEGTKTTNKNNPENLSASVLDSLEVTNLESDNGDSDKDRTKV